jgi:hypothetical protein
MRRVLGRGRFWSQNMGRIDGVGVQGSSLAFMGWVYGNIFAWVGRSLAAISGLFLVRGRGFVFGRTFGVGIEPSRRFSLICLTLPAIKGRLLQIIWSAQMVAFNGTSNSLGCSMTGRRRWWLRFIRNIGNRLSKFDGLHM